MKSKQNLNGFSAVTEEQSLTINGGVLPAIVGATVIWAVNAGLLTFGLEAYAARKRY